MLTILADRVINVLNVNVVNVLNVYYINVMNVNGINKALLSGAINTPGLFPHIEALQRQPYKFTLSFGLDSIPEEPGLILIHGARQYGKSTWLEQELSKTVEQYGAGSGLYLNGDELVDTQELLLRIEDTVGLFNPASRVRRLFIDEITAVKEWQRSIKRCADAGLFEKVLVIATGSKATDLRRGTERLPGRKGRLDRTWYYFTPVSYGEFTRVCTHLGDDALNAYLLSGGSPVACAELGCGQQLPEYVAQMMRDWLYGECALGQRDRSSMTAIVEAIIRHGGSTVGQASLAEETGMANNTVAAGYIQFLADLMCVGISHAWDPSHKVALRRKPAKYHFTNTLCMTALSRERIRSPQDLATLSPALSGAWTEWAVAQELWRRAAKAGHETPEEFLHYRSKEHELDFVIDENTFLEVKHGGASPVEFSWFPRSFPNGHLTVINRNRFETSFCQGILMEDFLLQEK